jgi:hypothetical protein
MAINFPFRTAFVVSQRFWYVIIFIFIGFQETFDFLSHFFYDPLIVEQCIIQLPIICVFFAVDFVVEF